MSSPVIGKDCTLAYDEISAWGTPSWNDVIQAQDVSMPGITKTAVDLPSRASQGWNLKGSGMKTLNLQFTYLYLPGTDAIFSALRTAFFSDTTLMFAVLDGPSDGLADRAVQGIRFAGQVFGMSKNQALEEGVTYDFDIEASYYVDSGTLRLPEWYTIAATG